MSDIFASPFFGITISILAFFIGLEIQKRTKIALCNPLLLAIILVIVFLKIFGISYDDYNEGGAIINMFLAPATACLAVSIYTKRRILKESWLPILVGCPIDAQLIGDHLQHSLLTGRIPQTEQIIIPPHFRNIRKVALDRLWCLPGQRLERGPEKPPLAQPLPHISGVKNDS